MAPKGFNQYMEFERGFHGWLTFFFITACLGALVRAYGVFESGRLLHLVLGNAEDMGVVGTAAGQLLVELGLFGAMLYGLRLFLNEDPRTPRYWTIFFLVSIPAVVAVQACTAFQTAHFGSISFSDALWSLLRSGGLRGMALALIWALYWMRSNRVRLTYGTVGFGG